mmetsp:Transcript_174845/g.560606  ORF Transcript_174845/g.560606 Transcript_174845/m.560606 type:complete len:529 (-) Transcript_174845:43-1629(-)
MAVQMRGKSKGQILRDLQIIEDTGEVHGQDGIEAAVALLAHSDPEVVAAALLSLSGRGEEAAWCAGPCARHLSSASASVRGAAALALGSFGGAAAEFASQLAKMMDGDKEDVRAKCVVALAQMGVESEAGRIADLVNDSSPVISAAACQALGLMGDEGERRRGLIAAKMDDPQTRHAAIAALGQLGASSCEPYVAGIASKGLTDSDSITRQAAAAAFSGVSAAALGPVMAQVVDLLGSDHVGVRCTAALALGYMGESALPHAAKLVELLSDTSEDMSEMHVQVGGVYRVFVTARRPKCAALVALGMIGAQGEARSCAKALEDDLYEVRLCALEALSTLGDAARAQSTEIAACLEDPAYFVRVKACQCIGALRAEDVMTSLPELFEDKAPSVKIAALQALMESPRIAESFPSEVFKCISDPVPLVKAAAVSVLGCMGDTGKCYASSIASMLNEQDVRLRCAACDALGKLGDHGAAFADEIELCLHSGVPELEETASLALERLNSASGGGMMIENFEGEGGHAITSLEGE